MKADRQPRRLLALNIIDSYDQNDLRDCADFVEVREVNAYNDVQDILLDARRSSDINNGDLFLIDVNLVETTPRMGLNWGSTSEVIPVGPLLALPFMGKEVCAFAPYSNYWGDENVINNGFVLLAVSFLLTISERRQYSLTQVRQHILSTAKAGGYNSPRKALNNALRQFRRNLENSDIVQLVDVGRTYERLEALETAMSDANKELSVPLVDTQGTLSIDFFLQPYGRDSIELSSLFADVLQFQRHPNPNDLTVVYEILDRWRRSKRCTETGGNLEAVAKAALDLCDDLTINEAVDKITPQALDQYLVKRIAMEFAWVSAWHDKLVVGDDGGWKEKLIYKVHKSLGLIVRKDASNDYKRLLGRSTAKKVFVSDEPNRGAFKEHYQGTNDAYQLGENEPAMLTPMERYRCREYAAGEFDWHGTDIPYPLWMTE